MSTRQSITVGLIAATTLAAGCGGGLRLSARIESAETTSASTTGIELTATVRAKSPSGAGLAVDGARVTIWVDDVEVQQSNVDLEPAIIVKSDEMAVMVPVTLDFGLLSTKVADAWSRPEIEYRMRVELLSGDESVNAGETSGSFTMLNGPKVTLDGIRFEGMAYGEPALKIDLRIFNENSMKVDLGALTTTVHLAGSLVAKNRKHDERLAIEPSGSISIRFDVPIDLDKFPELKRKIAGGFETLSFSADGKATLVTAHGSVSADYHVEGGIVLSR